MAVRPRTRIHTGVAIALPRLGPGALGGVPSVRRSGGSGHEGGALAGGRAHDARDARLAYRRQRADRVSRVLAGYAFVVLNV